MQPTSLLGSGFIEEEGDPQEQASILAPQGAMPLQAMSMMAQPPSAPASPMLAGLSGMLAARQGQAGNPYLAQHQQQQQISMQLGQNNQMIKLMEMQQRRELAKQTAETKKNELLFKVSGDLLKNDNEAAQQKGAETYSLAAKKIYGINIPAGDLLAGQHAMKDKEREDVDQILLRQIDKLNQLPPGTPPPPPDFSEIVSIYPKMAGERGRAYLTSRFEGLKNPVSRRAIFNKDIDIDPVAVRNEQESRLVTAWQKGNKAFADDKKYAIADTLFQLQTVNAQFPQGRKLHTAGPLDGARLMQISAIADGVLQQQKEMENGLNRSEVATKLAAMRSEIRAGTRREDDPEYLRLKENYDLDVGPTVVAPYGGLARPSSVLTPVAPPAGTVTPAGTAPAAGPLAPQPGGIQWVQKPTLSPEQAGQMGEVPGTPVDEAVDRAQREGNTTLTASQRAKLDTLKSTKVLLESVKKDIVGLNKIRDVTERFTGAPERYWAIQGQANPKAASAHSRIEGTLARLARSIGDEVGAMTEGDVERARKLWPVLTPGIRFGGPGGMFPIPQIPDTDAVVEQKFKDLNELIDEIVTRTGKARTASPPFKGDIVEALTGRPVKPQSPIAPKAGDRTITPEQYQRLRKNYSDDEIRAKGIIIP
jgi:hypothetical protein